MGDTATPNRPDDAACQQIAEVVVRAKNHTRKVEEYILEVQMRVRSFLESVPSFDQFCQMLFQSALAGQASELQLSRDRFLHAYQHRLELLFKARVAVKHAARISGRELPEALEVEKAVEALKPKLAKLERRWQTAEDLEDLAAESLAPSREKFLAIQKSLPYPEAWHEETTKPF